MTITRRIGVDLSECHGKRIAVVLSCQRTTGVFYGVASYEFDETLSNVLRIRVEDVDGDNGEPEIIISEREWDGEIENGREYGCDACLIPSPAWPPV